MGYQDRDYYREEGMDDPLGIRALSMTAKLIIITVFVFLVDMFFGGEDHTVNEALLNHADWFVKPWQFYQLLTSGFVHDPNSIKHILGNMIGLWIFGRLLEDRLGAVGLLRYYLLAIIFSSLVWSTRHFFLMGEGEKLARSLGASGGVVACIVLFCLYNPRATMMDKILLPIPAWIFGVIIVAIDMFGIEINKTPGSGRTAFDAHLAGAAFAVAIWALKINFARNAVLDAPGRWLRPLTNWLKRKPALRVHRDSSPDEDSTELDELEMEGDRILAKISSQGDSSLTAKERRTLEKYSRLMRDKRK
jgi:membrane associated rhomboid family serine protease